MLLRETNIPFVMDGEPPPMVDQPALAVFVGNLLQSTPKMATVVDQVNGMQKARLIWRNRMLMSNSNPTNSTTQTNTETLPPDFSGRRRRSISDLGSRRSSLALILSESAEHSSVNISPNKSSELSPNKPHEDNKLNVMIQEMVGSNRDWNHWSVPIDDARFDKTTIGPRSKLPALKARAQSTSAFPEEAMRKAVTFPDPRQGFAVTIKSASPSPSRSQSTIQLPMDAIAKANSQVAISLSNRETRTQKQWFTEFWSEDVASREHLRNRELLDACIVLDAQLVKSILSSNAHPNVNCFNKNHSTPLHMAAKANRMDIVTLLLQQPDIVVNCEENGEIGGNSPLHYAALNNNVEMALALLKKGADINLRNSMRLTPKHIASRKGFREFVDRVVEFEEKTLGTTQKLY